MQLDYKDIIIKHYALSMSGSEIARQTGFSKSGVNDFLRAFKKCEDLSYPLPAGITNYGIALKVYGAVPGSGGRNENIELPDYEDAAKLMATRKNMTLMLLCHMRSSFSMPLLYHAYVYLEFLILACTIYILAPNQISKNVNIGNRKKLINGNGFVFGVPGSGKSFFCKMEMGSVFLSGDDEIIVIDPMNEYFDIAETYGGTVVNMSTYTDNYVNPLEMDVWSLDPNDSKGMVREKGEFMLGLCEQCIGDSLNSRQKSIIDRCVRKLYIDIARSKEKYIPVMSDFYDILMAQPEDEAKDIALSLELFVNGSLNIFNHQTNVDVDNRFTVYGIRDLGTELSPITMLVMMESIQNRIVENGKRGKATWLYIDEFHVLLNSEYSAKYLQQLWKKVRKQGGLCTGITQNVVDLLQNYTATTMLANSEFVALLKQANTDSSKMAEVIGVSEAQLRFVTNTASGMGLIKCGSVVIPFDNQISKDTDLYRLYNTNIHEKIAEQKKREMQNNVE